VNPPSLAPGVEPHLGSGLSAHDTINNLLRLRRNYLTADRYRTAGARAFGIWAEVTGIEATAA
jgi:hypothetical protein